MLSQKGNILIISILIGVLITGGLFGAYYLGTLKSNSQIQNPIVTSTSQVTPSPISNTPTMKPSPSASPMIQLNLVFKYGVGSKNILDTNTNTFTKDLVIKDSVTTSLKLTLEEKSTILNKIKEINFSNYPNKFAIPPDSVSRMITKTAPFTTYYFKVDINGQSKEVTWDYQDPGNNKEANDLLSLINLITSIIESKPEYKSLPQAQGGYL